MEDAIKEELEDADIELIRGAGGIFDVHADGELLFSKHEEDRFPEDEEILGKLRTLASA